MKKKKIILSLLTAAMLPVLPCSPAEAATDIWRPSNLCYNLDGELQYERIYNISEDTEITIPEEINGIKIKYVEPISFIDKWTHYHPSLDHLTVYVPESVEIYYRSIYDDNLGSDMSRWQPCFSADFILSDGRVLHYHGRQTYHYNYLDDEDIWDYEIIEDENGKKYIKVLKYNGLSETEYSPSEINDIPVINSDTKFINENIWDYETLEDENGEQYIKLLKYNGISGDIHLPEKINDIPVRSIGTKVFDDDGMGMSTHLTIPDSITEFDDDCFYGLNLATIFYGNFDYLLVQDDDPETTDHLVITRINYHHKSYEIQERLQNRNGYDWDAIKELVSEEMEEYFKSDEYKPLEAIANYPVKGFIVYNWYDNYNYYVSLPDSVSYIRSNVFPHLSVSNIKIPKELKILPTNFYSYGEGDTVVEGLENVMYMPKDVYADHSYDGDESIYPPDKLLPDGISFDDPFYGFHINDDEGRTFRIYMDKKDFNYYAHFIYEAKDTGKAPEKFMGFPVIDERSDTLYPISEYITIPEDMKEVSITDFKFDPLDFPQLKEGLSADTYDTFEAAINAKLKYNPLKDIKKIDVLSKDLTIAEKTFYRNDIKEISFPGNVVLKNLAFGSSSLEKVSFTGDDSSIKISQGALGLSPIKDISFPDKVDDLYLGKNALSGIPANKIVLPEGTSFIGESCFSGCSSLKKLTINGSPKIDDFAFSNCTKLEDITFNGKPQLGKYLFNNCKSLKNINIDLDLTLDGNLFNTCPSLETLNGEDVFDKNGVPKEKFIDFIERNMKSTTNNKITDKYVMYRVKKLVSETVTDDMTDMEKVKALHDNLCSMVEYDTGNEDDPKNHTDISVFLNEKTVCEGYSRAFNLILHEAGIETYYLKGPNHAWNIVNLGGHYFHIDSTWDDNETIGYDWFLKSDNEIRPDASHANWELEKLSSLHDFQGSKLPVCSEVMGDVNSDGIVDAVDASAVLRSYAKASAGEEPEVDMILSDVNFNGRSDAADASAILSIYAKNSITV